MKRDKTLSLNRQLVILFLIIVLLTAWHLKVFKKKYHNDLALAFSVVLILWLITISLRYFCNFGMTHNKKKRFWDRVIFKMPKSVKCFIGDINCKKGDITLWTVFHFIIYFVVGVFLPHHYIEILLISIGCELLESGIGHTSKYIVDPVVNMLGYIIGSQFSKLSTK